MSKNKNGDATWLARPGCIHFSGYFFNQAEPLLMYFKPRTSFTILLAGFLIAIFTSTAVFAQATQSTCGPLRSGSLQYGPYDYRTDKPKLGTVEVSHFSPSVEALVRGDTRILPGGDLDYTLRAFPNHHRALLAMVRYGEKMQSPQPAGARYPVECYFDRALRFRPDDTIVRMIYARFLSKNARTPEAIQQLAQATAFAGDNAFSHYNIGLIYFDLKDYDKALVQAHKAISLGFLQSALRDQLQSVGQWTEPAVQPLVAPETVPANQSVDGANPPANEPMPKSIQQ